MGDQKLQDVQERVFFAQRDLAQPKSVPLSTLGDKGTFAPLHCNQVFKFELRQRFTHHSSANGELFEQFPLARQLMLAVVF
ncbi:MULTISPECIES: hypothetical protein [Pseudomonas]|jgi:hypothetical protein|uniref:hypothetical protein n=1 Tax=unclassified Pseudomonas TaxID=196821 RepID=UPI001E4ACC72|nr:MULTISPECIES: hypothetical protein [Pseudomonas]MCP9733029.1 hypothetical protein [Pseudomonas sp. GBPI_506]MEC4242199.1 hypothetical protein [Pseudomonas sp. DSV-1]